MIVNLEQNQASNPFDSVWVSASAGTGKTKVLIDRVLRLLLQYGNPDKILCITFTKAAAAEMSNRLTDKLKTWAIMDEATLSKDLQELTQETPDSDQITRAKSLFSQILQIPGGMKIMTIHSFCQSLLKQFPLEADVPPHFKILDDLKTNEILTDILNKTLADKSLVSEVQLLSDYVSMTNLIPLFKNLLSERSRLSQLLSKYPGSIESVIFAIKQYLHIEQWQTKDEIIQTCCQHEEWNEYCKTYLNKDGSVPARTKHPELAESAYITYENVKKWELVQLTRAFLRIAYRVLEQYDIYKQHQAFLDYNDLIDKTKKLLTRSDMAAWVLFKLDGGLNHILVDEAQDTSPDQWAIIRMLAEEFFSGEGKSEVLRTLFVVGDKKQSIYSFQGADPFEFERMKKHFAERIVQSQNTFMDIPLNYSFRSTEPVLRLVNTVLQSQNAKDGVLFNQEQAVHLVNRVQDGGLVEIWPLEEPKAQDTLPPWKPPVERVENASAMQRLIDKIADKIASMIGHDTLESQGRPIQAGDILILLQKRQPMMIPFVKALQKRHIPVAGVDRMNLTDYIAVQDLMALTEFVLQPNNDLNLACVLKSPLIGFTEDQVYQACINRPSSVWQQVQTLFPEPANTLKRIMNLADTVPPFEFYSTVLGAFHGRKNFIARLGLEVNEALDEFLNLALKFEETEAPSLYGFLNWLYNQEIEIKRDLEENTTNAVRIMTVHGSKGLQGNIVFLPDTRGVESKSSHGGNIIWTENGLPVLVPSTSMHVTETQNLNQKQQELLAQEKRRLLYVALTRASDRLYIAGYNPRKPAMQNNWYDLIVQALGVTGRTKEPILRWASQQSKDPKRKVQKQKIFDFDELPDWVNKPASPEHTVPTPISPSKLATEDIDDMNASPMDTDRLLALKRGTFIHQLLQLLPTIPPQKWSEILQLMTPPDIELPSNLLDIFHNPQFQELFGPDSLAEVPVIGKWNNMPISGQIDRLIIKEREVLIIDFKTNRYVPSEIPAAYKMQLNAYKGLLKQIFPDKMVKSYLLWIQTMQMEEII
ncbi:MAG: UvrD-helicase domain-containing protein [Alphaproteobacteria bacterium]|nr:UvrD-helicase domain-containing protein [Alphaproteobacteria bacterium]